MSALEVKTLQSPNNFNLTLDAQGSGSDIIIQSNGSQVASITDAGLLTATTFAGSGASLTALPAAQLTGSLPAISGASLTGMSGPTWELVASITSTGNASVTIGGDSSPIFSSSHDTYVLTGIIKTNQSSSSGMQLQPILAGAGTTADATDNVQHIAPLMRSNQANGSTALTFTHQDILTSYNVDFNYNPMGSGTGMAHAFNMWLYDPFQNASFAHYQLANATVASYDSNSYTSNLNYAYKKATTTAYVGLKLTNVAAGGLDYNLRLYGIKNS